jgi:hypothetical protein
MAELCPTAATLASLDEMAHSQRLLEVVATIRNDAATAEVIAGLDRAGIPSILLKGKSIASWLYDVPEDRSYVDVDLLVSHHDFVAAGSVLSELGFTHVGANVGWHAEDAYDEPWHRPVDGAHLELHRTLVGVGASSDTLWHELSQRTERLALGISDTSATILDPAARTMLLALHAAAHGAKAEKPLRDLTRGIERVAPEVWDEAANLARRVEAVTAFEVGLSLVAGGEDIARRNNLSTLASTKTVLRAMSAPPMALGIASVAQAQGLRRKIGLLARELIPPPDFMRFAYPLAQRGPGGLILAYLRRPFILARRFPAAVRAYQKARHTQGAAGG